MVVDTRHVLDAPTMIYEETTFGIDEKTKFNIDRIVEIRKTQTLTEKITNKMYTCYFK